MRNLIRIGFLLAACFSANPAAASECPIRAIEALKTGEAPAAVVAMKCLLVAIRESS